MKKIKVGDKVRCINGTKYDYVTEGKVYKVTEVAHNHIYVMDDEGDRTGYLFEDFEPITKTLDNLEVGDVLVNLLGEEHKILGICGEVYFISCTNQFASYGFSTTIKGIKAMEWKLKEELEPKVKKAIKLLEEKGYKVTQ